MEKVTWNKKKAKEFGIYSNPRLRCYSQGKAHVGSSSLFSVGNTIYKKKWEKLMKPEDEKHCLGLREKYKYKHSLFAS